MSEYEPIRSPIEEIEELNRSLSALDLLKSGLDALTRFVRRNQPPIITLYITGSIVGLCFTIRSLMDDGFMCAVGVIIYLGVWVASMLIFGKWMDW